MNTPFSRARLFLNPTAGRGRTAHIAESLKNQLGLVTKSLELAYSQSALDLGNLASQARRDGVDLVLVAGGDGSVHHVARGLLEEITGKVPTLGILPLGSANDFAYSLDLSKGWWQKPGWKVGWVDHGWIQLDQNPALAFVNGVGLGLNAMVTVRSQKIGLLRGIPLYTAALLQSLVMDWRKQFWKVLVNNQPLTEITEAGGILALSVLNGRREGNFDLCPNAKIDDGLFSVMAVRPMGRFRAFCLLPSLVMGTFHQGKGPILFSEGTHIVVESTEGIPCHADGEVISIPLDGIKRVEIRLAHNALPVIVGPSFSFC